MKVKTVKILVLSIALLVIALPIIIILLIIPKPEPIVNPFLKEGYERQEFSSKLTEQEHIARIYDIEEQYYNGRTKVEVYLLYSFDNVPEYFLIQRYCVDLEGNFVPLSYSLGFIENDKYYLFEVENDIVNQHKTIGEGASPYLLANTLGNKKYYAEKTYYGLEGIYAWENSDGEIIAYNPEKSFSGKYLNDELTKLSQEQIEQYKANRFVSINFVWECVTNRSQGFYRTENKSEYTEEEHQQRILELYSWSSTKIEVHILYSFEDNPEYFIVKKHDGAVDGETGLRLDSYDMGYILNDEYYILYENGLRNTYLNSYEKADVLENKKYYGGFGQFAWETEDGKIMGYEVVDSYTPVQVENEETDTDDTKKIDRLTLPTNRYEVTENVIELTQTHIELYKSIRYIKRAELSPINKTN